ncbi:hypothetical protein PVAP13_5NG284068 [Panicum virgatum]|uniref:Uncharacterized protein n=1 Tax=Panicum virgatum TaxID=38727 RepID=A0A8T0S0C7_PANVG|nr:hypothetical protein PVAP13_5NG284068 [Panicum virgatum]
MSIFNYKYIWQNFNGADSFCRIHPRYKIIDADGNSDRLRSMMFIKQIFRSIWCLTSILIIY